jgi:uncharacterized protein YjiS (DUF1127 family)
MKTLINTVIHHQLNEQHDGFIVRLLRTLTLWREVRRERRELRELSDRELADIGINRMDVLRECELPFWETGARDPSPLETPHCVPAKGENIERSVAQEMEGELNTLFPAEQPWMFESITVTQDHLTRLSTPAAHVLSGMVTTRTRRRYG